MSRPSSASEAPRAPRTLLAHERPRALSVDAALIGARKLRPSARAVPLRALKARPSPSLGRSPRKLSPLLLAPCRGALLLVSILCASACGNGSSSSSTSSSSGGSSSSSAPASAKTFEEGGALTLDLAGQPATIPLQSIEYANTDDGHPDYVEFSGAGTSFVAKSSAKPGEDAEGYVNYAVIAAAPLPIEAKNYRDEPGKLTVSGVGEFPVVGGSLALERFEHGANGRDWWEGRIEIQLQTASGPRPAAGTFAFCIVPVW